MLFACLRLFTSTSKLSFLVSLTVFGLALVEITFSLGKGEDLPWQTSSNDSITMNLRKSTASFSESDSKRFCLVYFLFEDAIYDVYFLLAMRYTTYHGVQLALGKNQVGNPFAFVVTGICNQYTRVEGRFPNRCQFNFLSTGRILIL